MSTSTAKSCKGRGKILSGTYFVGYSIQIHLIIPEFVSQAMLFQFCAIISETHSVIQLNRLAQSINQSINQSLTHALRINAMISTPAIEVSIDSNGKASLPAMLLASGSQGG